MYAPPSKSSFLLSAFFVALAALFVWWQRFRFRWLRRKNVGGVKGDEQMAAILTFYSAGHELVSTRGKIADMRYSLYATIPGTSPRSTGETFVDDTAAIYQLDLPFNTQTHLIGLSKQHKLDRVEFGRFLAANNMEPVELEGDFPDYFDVYAAKDQQVVAREVLNPKSMAFVVDYCRTHFWEINNAEMYFAATTTDKASDSIIKDSLAFVTQVKPALLPGEPGAAPVHHDVPYGEYDGAALNCPICNKTMTMHDAWQACPDGHGVLINGRDIIRMRNHELTIPNDSTKATQHGSLTCPNCHHPMNVVNYEEGGIEIDACENCPFRWLDANEVDKLGSKV